MSPHALTPESSSRADSPRSMMESRRAQQRDQSLLQRYDDEEVHDVVCVGFGPASLAIAVALHDALETGDVNLKTETPKIRFLEKQKAFAWHAGMLLPGAKMQITFIKDLATMRNPRSSFTFLNYLHQNGRLAAFTNLGTFLPQRIEYEDYMRWAANRFEDVVDYDMQVKSVRADLRDNTGRIESFAVTSVDSNGRESTVRAKNVVIAAGGRPNLPKNFPVNNPRVLHSSQYATHASSLFKHGRQPRSVAVIGSGQSAAEVFHNIPSRFPGAKAHLLIRGAALRPSDDSPFVNEIFDPEKVNDFYGRDADIREKSITLDKATNYGVVRLELLDEIYSSLYSQKLTIPNEKDRPLHILNYRNVTSAEEIQADDESRIRLHIQNSSSDYCAAKADAEETLDVDLVIVASGYLRDSHEEMLQELKNLMPTTGANGKTPVNRDYSVQFNKGAVEKDAGIWLQGCNEATHGLSDTLLSILSIRGGEMVESIFGEKLDVAPKLNGLTNGH